MAQPHRFLARLRNLSCVGLLLLAFHTAQGEDLSESFAITARSGTSSSQDFSPPARTRHDFPLHVGAAHKVADTATRCHRSTSSARWTGKRCGSHSRHSSHDELNAHEVGSQMTEVERPSKIFDDMSRPAPPAPRSIMPAIGRPGRSNGAIEIVI